MRDCQLLLLPCQHTLCLLNVRLQRLFLCLEVFQFELHYRETVKTLSAHEHRQGGFIHLSHPQWLLFVFTAAILGSGCFLQPAQQITNGEESEHGGSFSFLIRAACTQTSHICFRKIIENYKIVTKCKQQAGRGFLIKINELKAQFELSKLTKLCRF